MWTTCFLVIVGALLAQEPGERAPDRRVIVIEPLVNFEQIQSGFQLPGSQFGADAYSAALHRKAVEALASRGTKPEAASAAPVGQLQTHASRLARGMITASARESLAGLGDDCLVLVQYVKGKVGPGGSWNPQTGAITSAMNSLLLQAALISSREGQVVWRNEVLLRDLPRATAGKFQKAVELLFADFKVK